MSKNNSQEVSPAAAKPAKKERIVWIDILRGAMMFFVVYGHSTARGDVARYIFSFHMPAFFIISGMTFSFNRETDPIKYLKKKLVGLIASYFLLNLYVSPLFYWNVHNGSLPYRTPADMIKGVLISNVDSGYKMFSNTTWFIPCLFITDMLFFMLWRIFRSDAGLAIASPVVTATVYAMGCLKEKGAGIWHWQTAFTALIFYMCGYFFMKNISAVKSRLLGSKVKAVLLSVLFFMDGYLLSELNGRVSMVNDSYKNTVYFYLSALTTNFAFIIIVMLLSEHELFLKLSKPVDQIGRTTLTYIAFHVPILRLLKHYVEFFDKGGEIGRLVLAAAVYIGLIPIACLVQKLLPASFTATLKAKRLKSEATTK